MLRRLGMLLAVPIAAFAFGGCAFGDVGGFYTGGGSLPGDDGAKATFGFVFNVDGQGFLKGTYHDPGAGLLGSDTLKIKFDGAFDMGSKWTKVNWVQQGKPMCEEGTVKCTGTGTLYVDDNGEPGTAGTPDYMSIKLYDCDHDFLYENHGFIEGGNIQFHPFDD